MLKNQVGVGEEVTVEGIKLTVVIYQRANGTLEITVGNGNIETTHKPLITGIVQGGFLASLVVKVVE